MHRIICGLFRFIINNSQDSQFLKIVLMCKRKYIEVLSSWTANAPESWRTRQWIMPSLAVFHKTSAISWVRWLLMIAENCILFESIIRSCQSTLSRVWVVKSDNKYTLKCPRSTYDRSQYNYYLRCKEFAIRVIWLRSPGEQMIVHMTASEWKWWVIDRV